MDNKVNCIVCGSEIVNYLETVSMKCYFCGIKEESHFQCEKGHFVCNNCHSQNAIEVITQICNNSKLINPVTIAEQIMQHPSVHMHGPEHHALIPAVLITTYQNYIKRINKSDILEGIKRGKQVPGGYCGFYGACAAGIGVGIALSVITKSTPLKAKERSQANFATSNTLAYIAAAGGSRCCKKSTRYAIESGVEYLSTIFKLNWYNEIDFNVKCDYSKLNKECDVFCKYRLNTDTY